MRTNANTDADADALASSCSTAGFDSYYEEKYEHSHVYAGAALTHLSRGSEALTHLVLHNFNTDSAVGRRVSTILRCLFPAPRPDSKRVVTFANTDDNISFRHHEYTKIGKARAACALASAHSDCHQPYAFANFRPSLSSEEPRAPRGRGLAPRHGVARGDAEVGPQLPEPVRERLVRRVQRLADFSAVSVVSQKRADTVSYTHLTLPTNREV